MSRSVVQGFFCHDEERGLAARFSMNLRLGTLGSEGGRVEGPSLLDPKALVPPTLAL